MSTRRFVVTMLFWLAALAFLIAGFKLFAAIASTGFVIGGWPFWKKIFTFQK